MLSESIAAELGYFLAMLLYGFLVPVFYYPLILVRTLIRHARAVVDAEDILFLMAAGFAFFLVAYEKNNGILRWYAFAGAGLGMLVYIHTVYAILERARKWLLQKFLKTDKIKAQSISKGQVSVDEGSSPKHGKKREKKKRT